MKSIKLKKGSKPSCGNNSNSWSITVILGGSNGFNKCIFDYCRCLKARINRRITMSKMNHWFSSPCFINVSNDGLKDVSDCYSCSSMQLMVLLETPFLLLHSSSSSSTIFRSFKIEIKWFMSAQMWLLGSGGSLHNTTCLDLLQVPGIFLGIFLAFTLAWWWEYCSKLFWLWNIYWW